MWRSGTSGRLLLGMLGLGAVLAAGCARLPRIDPTGEHFFIWPPASPPAVSPGLPSGVAPGPPAGMTGPAPADNRYHNEPGLQENPDYVVLLLAPADTVAPIGTEVVLVAGVGGPDGRLRTNSPLQWSIASGSVGQFVDVGKAGFSDLLVGDFNPHKKIDNTFAVGSTSRQDIRLTRGTPNPADDVLVKSGEGWVSLTSPLEGTTQVNVLAPDVYGWDRRMKTARIHWVDASWVFPPPAINPAGTRHVFTTSVIKRSNQTPCAGWIVRYTITGGPPAGFAPDGTETIEVRTNESGQAGAEIFQKMPTAGTNQIRIEVIRPGDLPGADGRMIVLGTGTTMKTWTAASLAVKILAPAVATVGGTLSYRIEAANPGDLPAGDVRVSDAVPAGLTYLSSNPPAETAGNVLLWRLGELAAGQTRSIEVNFRAEKEGSVTNCADATASGGLKVSECATTTVAAAPAAPTGSPVALHVNGPPQAAVGSDVTFEIVVANRGPTLLQGLKIIDHYGPGLQHVRPERTIKYLLDDLPAGQSQSVPITFRVVQAGQLSHTVQVMDAADRVLAESTASLAAVEGAAPSTAPGTEAPAGQPAPPGPSPGAPPPPGSAPAAGTPSPPTTVPAPGPTGQELEVQKTGPTQRTKGEIAAFTIILSNKGNRPLTKLQIVDQYAPELQPAEASRGYRFQPGQLTWTLDSLLPGRRVGLEVRCSCMEASPRAVNQVTVVTAEGVRAESSAIVEILGAGPAGPGELPARPGAPPTTPGGPAPPETPPAEKTPPAETPSAATPPPTAPVISLSMIGKTNPVNLGKDLVYVIQVENKGAQAVGKVRIQVTLPPEIAWVPLGTTGPNPTVKPEPEGQTIRFTPLAEIPAGQTVLYHLRVRPKSQGTFKAPAELTSPDLPQPLAAEASTTVN